jgi:hypothetical protein
MVIKSKEVKERSESEEMRPNQGEGSNPEVPVFNPAFRRQAEEYATKLARRLGSGNEGRSGRIEERFANLKKRFGDRQFDLVEQ